MTKIIVPDFPRIEVNNRSASFRKSLFGVGINDADYLVRPRVLGKKITCPFYMAWTGMMSRCYSESFHRRAPTYRECSVDPAWHSFMTFRSWMAQQDWQGNALDKDILIPGNKIYSPDTCVFVSLQINSLLNRNLSRQGKYLQGVCWCKSRRKFRSYIKIKGRNKSLGRFDSEQEAHSVASKAKAEHIKNVAQTQLEPIRSGLLRHAALFMEQADA